MLGSEGILQVDTGESFNKSVFIDISTSDISLCFASGSVETNGTEEQSGLIFMGKMDVTVEGDNHLGTGKIAYENGGLKLDTYTHEASPTLSNMKVLNFT